MDKTQSTTANRRGFLKGTLGLTLSAIVIPVIGYGRNQHYSTSTEKKPPLSSELVYEFVRNAHSDIAKVKEMLEKEPGLVNACWDWGGGDFETALGGSSHMGNRAIATYLLEKGARKDIFCSAMLGEVKLVTSFIETDADIVNVKGPHGISFLSHVAISGEVDIALKAKPHLKDVASACNHALHAAVKNGHLPMTEWLLANGVTDLNTLDFAGSTPLQTAEKKGFKDIVGLLRKNGGS